MYVIKIEVCGKCRACRSGKEVETSVSPENGVALFDDRLYGSENENIIVTVTAGKLSESLYGIFAVGCVQIYELYAVFCGFFGGEYAFRTGKACGVYISDNEKRRFSVTVDGIIYCAEAMGPTPARMAVFPPSFIPIS